MKRHVTAIITGILAAGLLMTACGGNAAKDTPPASSGSEEGSGMIVPSGMDDGGAIVGGWTVSDAGVSRLSEEEQQIFDAAAQELLGVDYTPAVVLATQLVSGTNYAFLCSKKVVVPDAEPGWCVVVIYRDLSGTSKVTAVNDIDLTEIHILDNVDTTQAVGAWKLKAPEENGVLSDEAAQAAFDKAVSAYVGVGLKPIALLGSQLVAGTNYKVLCYGTTVTQEPVESLYIADVYADLEGGAVFSDVQIFDFLAYIEQEVTE